MSSKIALASLAFITGCTAFAEAPGEDPGAEREAATDTTAPMPVPAPTPPTAPKPAADPSTPSGQWSLAWADEFNGSAPDSATWDTQSAAYGDLCRANPDAHENQYSLVKNIGVADGFLRITARRERVNGYGWSSGLVTTGHTCRATPKNARSLHVGDLIVQRAKLPNVAGTWASLAAVAGTTRTNLLVTNDVSDDWHLFAAYLGADAIRGYVDGKEISRNTGFAPDPSGPAPAVLLALAIDDGALHPAPAAAASSAELLVDWVRVYTGTPESVPGAIDLCRCTDPGVPFAACPAKQPRGCP